MSDGALRARHVFACWPLVSDVSPLGGSSQPLAHGSPGRSGSHLRTPAENAVQASAAVGRAEVTL